MPPATTIVSPVIYDASLLTRKATVLAHSSGVPTRPIAHPLYGMTSDSFAVSSSHNS